MNYRVLLGGLVLFSIVPTWASAEPLVRFHLEAFDSLDQSLTTVSVGEEFTLRGYVEDLRQPQPTLHGVEGAYAWVGLDATKVTSPGSLAVAPFFEDLFPLALLDPDFLVAGGISLLVDLQQLPTGEQLQFSLPMQATSVGLATFSPGVPTGQDLEWYLFGLEEAVAPADIELVGLVLNVVPEPSSLVLASISLCGVLCAARAQRQRRVSVRARGLKL